ncbi:D-2-hydroxyacid dehydrogenase [Bacillus sp. Marseille-P3661]|uniref:D-2-hydroxyacid dehydrogenase n=1 Tax=Bacillus sp. Marseille-P3661 TaxID=1936234 RepID=UPI000C86805C|nr:D-2-hydroxyacid dehydrogenase [Bacillus sp. Marseille-P3661]
MRIVSAIKIKDEIQALLQEEFKDVSFLFYNSIEEAEKSHSLGESEVLLTYGEDIKAEHIKKASKLKWIMLLTAGFEQLPLESIVERNIVITNVKGIHKTPMAEYTILMMLQETARFRSMMDQQKQKVWNKSLYLNTLEEITEKTVAILGTGVIGSEIARLAKAFNMKTMGFNRSGTAVEHVDQLYTSQGLFECLRKADFVVSILPSTTETKGFLKGIHFKEMKKTAVFINIGRGNTVVEEDLVYALQTKEIKHAVLDVFAEEPLPSSHPFWEMENVTITPHIAGVSTNYQDRAIEIFKHNLQVFRTGVGELLNVIDIEKGY